MLTYRKQQMNELGFQQNDYKIGCMQMRESTLEHTYRKKRNVLMGATERSSWC
jgi:phage anti-repressor protein